MVKMFENVDKKKNKRNASVGIFLIIIPIILYILNSNLRLPNIDEIQRLEILVNDKKTKTIELKDEIKELYDQLDEIHGKYLVLGNDGTKIEKQVNLVLKNNKIYIIKFRDATIEYNGNLYDVNPDTYMDFKQKI